MCSVASTFLTIIIFQRPQSSAYVRDCERGRWIRFDNYVAKAQQEGEHFFVLHFIFWEKLYKVSPSYVILMYRP